jgi:histidyl-tRNA synthetase
MKPSIPQGTRDFTAVVLRKRKYIMQTIQDVFETYGFEPLETPAMENLDTLMGKYGEEGDKLIFKILNNGLALKADKARPAFEEVLQNKNTALITERALKYDLTVPFARFVAMNHTTLTMPYKRYQMQPVWRADRPQKGRYREFYQCDADVVGSGSLYNEADFVQIFAAVFNKLKLSVVIKINNRKILAALASLVGGVAQLTAITVAIDKLDKIGIDKVKEELLQRGLTTTQVESIATYLAIKGDNEEMAKALFNLLGHIPEGAAGIKEIETVIQLANINAETIKVQIDQTLARGLNYYTGCIFEVAAQDFEMGSIAGGGRYDNLTESFGVPNIPGVGISFGLDRIYDVMEGVEVFPSSVITSNKVLMMQTDVAAINTLYQLVTQLRAVGIAAELYHTAAKIDKQFKYAEAKGFTMVVIPKENNFEVKNLITSNRITITEEAIIATIKQQFEL